MGQPVKLSDTLVLDARVSGELTERSIAGQIEFWASLGRAIEPLLQLDTALALRKSGTVRPLSECLAVAGTRKGQQQLAKTLQQRPFPHYEPVPDRPGYLVRIEADGTRQEGRFIKRRFIVSK